MARKQIEPTTFRTASGNRKNRQLFWEIWSELPTDMRVEAPVFTLHADKPGLINLRKAYVELGDPTGYKLSQIYLENYDFWLFLMKSTWFRKAKEIWDVELDAKLASEGMTAIRSFAEGFEGLAPAVQLNAAKFLANKDYRDKKTSAPRGRPSAEEVSGNLKIETEEARALEEDLARIRSVK